jgi:hypothetical protein
MKSRIPAFGLLLLSIGASGADYQQTPSLQYLLDSDPRSLQPYEALIAEDFQLSADTPISTIRWWGSYDNRMAGEFQLAIWTDVGSRPGSLISELRSSSLQEVATGRAFFGGTYQEFAYTATLETPFSAQAGVHYWLSIGNATLIPGNWTWESGSDSQFPGIWRRDSDGIWNIQQTDLNMAFAVPEPSPLHLGIMFFVLGSLVRLISRRNRSAARA